MSSIVLEYPERLAWLLVVPALFVALWWARRAHAERLSAFISKTMQRTLVVGGRPRLGAALVLFAVACLVLALSGVHVGTRDELVEGRGVDIVVALDVSDSMLARDVESRDELSRLGRAKREIKDLLARLDGDRIGLVVFAGEARIELPLTLDYEAAASVVDRLDTDMLDVKGTAIADAIEVAVQAFDSSVSQGRAVILITDGEDTEGDAENAARKAKEANVHVFGLAVGSDAGAPIPQAQGGFRRKAGGDIILSRVDEPMLESIAQATGGDVVRSASGDYDLERIYNEGVKKRVEARDLATKHAVHGVDQFRWLVGAAAVALMAQAIVRKERVL